MADVQDVDHSGEDTALLTNLCFYSLPDGTTSSPSEAPTKTPATASAPSKIELSKGFDAQVPFSAVCELLGE